MENRVRTLHPDGKQGVNILKDRYDTVRKAILSELSGSKETSFIDLTRRVNQRLRSEKFDGRPSWYVVTVKLDLEARGVIERIPNAKPQRLRMR
jgi:hypothetical protein